MQVAQLKPQPRGMAGDPGREARGADLAARQDLPGQSGLGGTRRHQGPDVAVGFALLAAPACFDHSKIAVRARPGPRCRSGLFDAWVGKTFAKMTLR
jgi:hypothetical protein